MNGDRAQRLVAIETHPIQYHAPIYRLLQQRFEIPVTAIYGSDFSVAGYRDPEFGATFAWDTDLLGGYSPVFLSRVSNGGARRAEAVSTGGLARALREAAPKAVLLTGYSPRFHQLAFCQALAAKCPILFRGETTDHARRRMRLKSWARDRALRWLYARCDMLLYVGQRSCVHFQRLGCPADKLMFSPYCTDSTLLQRGEEARSRLRPVVRRSLGINEEQMALLFCGKLSQRKQPHLILLAVRQLPVAVQEKTVILFIGDGEMRSSLGSILEGAARSGPAPRALFLGFQNQSCLSQYYHTADLLVLPSQEHETWGLVVNEALDHGIPCVVSDQVGCAPDLIEPGLTGEICEAGSLSSLASAIQRAMVLTGRPEIREACRQRVSGYSVEKAAEGIARAYRSLFEQRRS